MTRSAILLALPSDAVDALLVPAHPRRWAVTGENDMEKTSTVGRQLPTSTRFRFLFPAGAWAFALLATAIPDFRVVVWTHLFPFGVVFLLATVVGFKLPLAVGLISILGWFVYLVLTGSVLLTRKRTQYWILYGLLCVLLILNIVGCHMVPPSGSNLM